MPNSFCFESSEIELILTLSRRINELSNSGGFVHPDELKLIRKGFDLLNLEARVALWRGVQAGGDSAGKFSASSSGTACSEQSRQRHTE